jgi:integrase
MSRIKLKHIHRFRDRHGVIRHYYRRAGYPRVALPGNPGSQEFMTAYGAADAGKKMPIGAMRHASGSLAALVAAWHGSSAFRQLAQATQTNYRNIADHFAEQHGANPVKLLQPKHVRRIIAAKASTPHAANTLLKVIRSLMKFAIDDEWIDVDPTIGVRKVRIRSEGFHSWTEDEIAIYENHFPIGSRPRLAFDLLLYTAQRRSDVVKMGRQHLIDGLLSVIQQKTGKRLEIPIHSKLRQSIEATPSDHLTYLTTTAGAPFTPAGFGNWFRDRCNEACLPTHCAAHGLRKAALRRLADLGGTGHHLKAISGQESLSEVDRYTRAADQRRLAKSAMAMMDQKDK